VFSLTSGDYITPQLIGGGHSLVGNLVAEQFGAVGNWPLGAAFSVLVLFVLFLLMAFLARWNVLENA
jgi:ABC-type spermidine/putrescine transport system permease subunit I